MIIGEIKYFPMESQEDGNQHMSSSCASESIPDGSRTNIINLYHVLTLIGHES